MKHLKIFNTHNSYDNFELDDTNTPNVSFCNYNKHVHYSKKIVIPNYLQFKALEPGTFTLTIGSGVTDATLAHVSYSLDNGKTWITTQNDNTDLTITTPTINAGKTVLWKGEGTRTAVGTNSTQLSKFSSTGSFECHGNIMSLLYGDNFEGKTSFPNVNKEYGFAYLFHGCTGMTTVPELPATTLINHCYREMFYGCTSLTSVSENLLPATELKSRCYISMFFGCSSLTNAPKLPAMTLQTYCYYQMFSRCSSLTNAPDLPAETLVGNCYQKMFMGCSNLNYIKAMFLTTPISDYTDNWVNAVANNGTFIKNVNAEWDVRGRNGIPTGWTVQTAAS
jgi:hypothetical protein